MKLQRLLTVTEPGSAGVLFYVCDILHWLMRVRPEVQLDLAYSSCRDSAELYKLVDDVKAHGGTTLDLRVGNAPQLRDATALVKLHGLIRDTHPNLIHAHSSKAGALVRILALFSSCPPVVYTPNAYFGLGEPHKLKSRVYNFIEAVLGRVGKTINGSGDEYRFAREVLKIPERRLVFIHHGINLAEFRPASAAEKHALRAQFRIPPGLPLLISLGRHSYQKNYPPLYAALNQLLSRERPPFFFAHAGSGSEQLASALSPKARAQVATFEYIGNPNDLVRSADALIMTSRYESPCYAVLEGLASGVKVFLTRSPGFLGQQQLGFREIDWIDSSNDGGRLAENIALVLQGWADNGYPMPSEAQLQLAQRWFNMETQLQKTNRLYDYLAAGQPRKSPMRERLHWRLAHRHR